MGWMEFSWHFYGKVLTGWLYHFEAFKGQCGTWLFPFEIY